MHSLITAAIAFGLLLAALIGVTQVDLDKVMGQLPRESPTLTTGGCPCKAAKERCTNDAGDRIFEGKCRMLWHECKEKRYGPPRSDNGWEACTLAKKKCADNRDGWCSSLWQKCGEERKAHSGGKDKAWACKAGKEKCVKDGQKVFEGRCGFVWKKCAFELERPLDSHLDWGIDGDWEKIRQMKDGIMGRMKLMQGDESKMKGLMAKAHELLKEAGVPEDRIEEILEEWAKNVAEEPDSEKKKVDTKDCYFDKECHKLVDWQKIGNLKMGIMGRMKLTQGDESKMKALMSHAHALFKEAGMPDDRIAYILEKWAKYVTEKQDSEKQKDDAKDCYFDKECHKLVNWQKIEQMKEGTMARMKFMQGDESKMKDLMAKAHELFQEAGMPDDRIDYILEKWAKYVAEAPKDHYHGCRSARKMCLKNGERVFEGKCRFLWQKCGKEAGMKETKDEWNFCKIAKSKCWKNGAKATDPRCALVWKKCDAEVEAHSGKKKNSWN